MTDPTTATLAAIQAAAKLWRIAEDEKLVKRVHNFFRKKETIVVLGSTGSGKTNLLDSLGVAAALVEPVSSITRTETAKKRSIVVDERPFVIIDTPGQKAHIAQRQEVYREALAKPPVRIINVVSYGYHEYATGSSGATNKDGSASVTWLKRHRQNELDAMKEWLPLLGNSTSTSWILTAVTKSDLWWNKRDEVLKYYTDGPYAAALRESDANIQHSVLPYSSVFHRFYGRAPLSGRFDDQDRIDVTTHFLRQLVDLG